MRTNCPNITVHQMGPCEGMHTRASRPLWANVSSSTRSVHSHRGPTSAATPLAANYAGPRDCLVRQPIVTFWGQLFHPPLTFPRVGLLTHLFPWSLALIWTTHPLRNLSSFPDDYQSFPSRDLLTTRL